MRTTAATVFVAVAASSTSVFADEHVMQDALVLPNVGRYGRATLHVDAVQARLAAGDWTTPTAGGEIARADGTVATWVVANTDGRWLKHEALRGGYASWTVHAPTDRIMILDASGHGVAYVNGLPRGGDPYGNADTNAAWGPLLGDGPVTVGRDGVTVGERSWRRPDLGVLFIRPRPGSGVASVGVVTGTGLAGMRLVERLPYFVSGIGYPDLIVLTPESLTHGDQGILAAGYFGLDWSVETGQFALSEPSF